MNTAKFFQEITVKDPDTNLPVEVDLFKHEGGGIFGIDASYLDQVATEDGEGNTLVSDPLNDGKLVILTGI
jgi:hypothetical protein